MELLPYLLLIRLLTMRLTLAGGGSGSLHGEFRCLIVSGAHPARQLAQHSQSFESYTGPGLKVCNFALIPGRRKDWLNHNYWWRPGAIGGPEIMYVDWRWGPEEEFYVPIGTPPYACQGVMWLFSTKWYCRQDCSRRTRKQAEFQQRSSIWRNYTSAWIYK